MPAKPLTRDVYVAEVPIVDLELLAEEAKRQDRSQLAQIRVELHRAATRIYRRRFRQAADELAAAKKGQP